MLTKFEAKSNRVKGLSLHAKRPWILASLHSGVIQLWDYRMGTLIDKFDEHDGPVRGLHFHNLQPLFVSGGDDYKIKVWNYKLHRCLFTLLGHLDYIRTVQFHHESPWIVSASDDQTVRIWNWQSRTCLSVLTGHNHFVMCASFHTKEDLVVSASLDQTVRVWDIGSLRKKNVSHSDDLMNNLSQLNSDLFGGIDVVVKYVLEGHDRGVNWASFHPTLPLIVSGADDRLLKLWRMNDTKAWEVDTLRGHINNVSCVMFHTKQNIIISNSEDKSIRVWDVTKRTGIHTFKREHDRFWILACHPETNLFAAGHDSGMIVFKLERERPAFYVSNDSMFYVKDRFLKFYDFSTQKETQVIPIRRPGSTLLNHGPQSLSYSVSENAVLICSDIDGGYYELYIIPKDSISRGDTVQDPKKGTGGSAVFVARNRFAVLDKTTNQVLIKNLKNEIVKKIVLPVTTDSIFYGGTGNLLCRGEDKMVIFDLQQRVVVGSLLSSSVKYIVWSNDMEAVALLSKHSIIIANKKLDHRCTVHETIRVKSGAWDENGVFIYTTLNHIKYCLPNGDNGIIKTLDVPIYITKLSGHNIFYLDREGKNKEIVIDATEYIFKFSLLKKSYVNVMNMIRNSNLCGEAMIGYLQKKGFPEIALHIVKDERTRFKLAIDSGNIQIAVAAAKEIDEKDYWYKLGVEALRQGNLGIVEYAYQKTKNFERLSFLYLITGNVEKLSKMLKIAEVKNDVMSQFHNAIYLGDIWERVNVLEKSGNLNLAYITASVHGLHDVAERISGKLEHVPELPKGKVMSLLMPPIPVISGDDWPLLRVMKGVFDGGLENFGNKGVPEDEEDVNDADWGEELDLVNENQEIQKVDDEEKWEIEDFEILQDTDVSTTDVFVGPTVGTSVSQIWIEKSSLAAEHVAAGNFDSAMRLLTRQLGIQNFSPLKSMFIDLHIGSYSYLQGFSSVPVLSTPLERGLTESNVQGPPVLVFNFSQLEEKLKAGYKATISGKFSEALRVFLNILHTIPLIVVESRREVDEVKEMILIVKEYVLGLQMELKRKELKNDPIRQQELAAYFTHCNLQVPHLLLALLNAMKLSYNAKNNIMAANFARRFLGRNPTNENQVKIARQVLQAAEKNLIGSSKLNYDFRNPFVICGKNYVPIYHGQKKVLCPFCSSNFLPSEEGKLCTVCDLAVIGVDASGLLCSPSQMS